jgi:hypothetical protein
MEHYQMWIILVYLLPVSDRRDVRVAEGARLESVYMPKVYRGFESLSLRSILNPL